MEAFLRTVDQTVRSYLPAIISGLATVGFTDPSELFRADSAEVIEAFPTEGPEKLTPPGKAFLRRAIEAVGKAQLVTDIVPVAAPLPVPRPEQLA